MTKRRSAATPPGLSAELSAYMKALGAKGGKASGAKRMTNLTPQQRREIASVAARARWKKRPDGETKA